MQVCLEVCLDTETLEAGQELEVVAQEQIHCNTRIHTNNHKPQLLSLLPCNPHPSSVEPQPQVSEASPWAHMPPRPPTNPSAHTQIHQLQK